MFKWLADLIVNSPVQGTCACGASHRAKLRQMQKEILAKLERLSSLLGLI